MPENKSILSVCDVSFSYGALTILDAINLEIMPKDFLAIIGPNGGGKSTLLKLIVGLLRPDQGQINLFGHSAHLGCRHVGYVSQYVDVDIHFPISVLDVVLMGSLSKGLWTQITPEDQAHALECLKKVGLELFEDRTLDQLSGGQRQRVFIARALMNTPKLLILDEPTTGVDSQAQKEFYSLLKTLHKSMAIVIVSHDLSAVSKLTKRVACLNRQIVTHTMKELSHEALEEIYKSHKVLKEHHHG